MLAEAQKAEESLNTLAAVAVKRNCDHFTYSTQMGRQGGSKDRCSFDDVEGEERADARESRIVNPAGQRRPSPSVGARSEEFLCIIFDSIDAHNVRMIQLRHGTGFAQKALHHIMPRDQMRV